MDFEFECKGYGWEVVGRMVGGVVGGRMVRGVVGGRMVGGALCGRKLGFEIGEGPPVLTEKYNPCIFKLKN